MLSVIIPTYNRPELISGSLRSVLNQTYKDLEVIVVDGSENDATKNIVASISDDRIKYHRVKNQSAANSRNIGIKMAEGEYIAFNDDDDEWLPEKAEKQLQILTVNPDAKVVYSSFTKRVRNCTRIIPDKSISKKSGDIFQEILLRNFIGLPTILVSKSCCEKEVFDENLPCIEDWDWFIRLSKSYGFEYVDESLVSVSDTPASVNKSSYLSKSEAYKKIYQKYFDEIEQSPVIEAKHLLSIGSNLCLAGKMKEGRKYLQQSLKAGGYDFIPVISLLVSFLGEDVYFLSFKLFEKITCREP